MTARAVVIIPHFNDQARLRRCLEALLVDLPAGVDVVVVDNGSHVPPATELAEDFPKVQWLTQPKPGAAMARNLGVAETRAEGLLFLDADCVPCAGWVQAGLDAMDHIDAAGGPVDVFDEGNAQTRTGAQAFEAVFAFDMRGYLDRVGFLGSGNLVTRRSVFDAVGPFRPGLSEDKDWSHRARAAGFDLSFIDAFAVGHPSRGDWPALRRKWDRLTEESWGLHRAEGKGRWRWMARALLMPASIVAHMPRILRSPRLRGPQERWRAIGTLARLRLTRMVWMLRQAIWA
ncbi:MAG: glycosyltransferase [Pseudomonadota bacterium]